MIAKCHPRTTRWLGAPRGWEPSTDGPCAHLAIADIPLSSGNGMESWWEPTPDELARLNAGAVVMLTVVGVVHPPVALEVGEICVRS